MASSPAAGIRGYFIAGFVVVAPLVAVFLGPLQDRIGDLLNRAATGPKPDSLAAARPLPAETPGFRPALRGGQQANDGFSTAVLATAEPTFPGEPGGPTNADSVVSRHRAARSGIARADPESSRFASKVRSEGGATSLRRPAGAAEGSLADGSAAGPRETPISAGDDADALENQAELASSDPLVRPYARLQSLGATSSRLESWGAQGTRYRFQCRVATDEDSTEARHFEATDAQPIRAIEKVVLQVENWQKQRR